MAGGRAGPLSDTKGEKSATFLLIAIAFLIGGIVLLIYRPSWLGVGNWLRDNWYIPLAFLVLFVFMYRAYQGISLFPRLERLHLTSPGGRSGGGQEGGGGSLITTLKWLLYIAIVILVLWLVLQILQTLDVWQGTVDSIDGWVGWPWNWW